MTVHRACSPTEVLYPEAPNSGGWVVGQELRSLSSSSLFEAPGKFLLLLRVGRRLAGGLVQAVYPMQFHLCCRVQPLTYLRLGRLIQIHLRACASLAHWADEIWLMDEKQESCTDCQLHPFYGLAQCWAERDLHVGNKC